MVATRTPALRRCAAAESSQVLRAVQTLRRRWSTYWYLCYLVPERFPRSAALVSFGSAVRHTVTSSSR